MLTERARPGHRPGARGRLVRMAQEAGYGTIVTDWRAPNLLASRVLAGARVSPDLPPRGPDDGDRLTPDPGMPCAYVIVRTVSRIGTVKD